MARGVPARAATGCWPRVGLGPEATKVEGKCPQGPKWASPAPATMRQHTLCTRAFVPWASRPGLLPLGGSPRSAGDSDAGTFQTMASGPRPGAGPFACRLEDGGLYFPQHCGLPRESSPVFKAKGSGGWSSQCRSPRLGSLTWGSDPSLLWRNLCGWNYSPIGWDLTVL